MHRLADEIQVLVKQRQPDISKARRILGWEPKIQLEQGLVDTIAYFRQLMK